MTAAKALAGAALVLGGLAAVAGSPYRHARGRVDVDELASVVAREEDHVTAVELAGWIRDRRPGLRVIDIRSPAEFAADAIPTAENVPLEALSRADFRAGDTVVLYSEGGGHAAQAWVLLRAAGVRDVFYLRRGLYEWQDDVLSPTLAENATPEEQAAFARVAELSRYFGGHPAIGPPADRAPARDPHGRSPAAPPRPRRGC